ncbi:P-loop NTPase fold protein [Lentisphaerota bacterium WC36G]|nr:ATP-binding protein [Lentisphaerae bacterium WC36]
MNQCFLNEPTVDLLNRTEFAQKLASFLHTVDSGVYSFEGGWGSGKSFLIEKILIKELINKITGEEADSKRILDIIEPHDSDEKKFNDPIIVLNAFKHDFIDEPFTAIAYEILRKLCENPTFKEDLNKKGSKSKDLFEICEGIISSILKKLADSNKISKGAIEVISETKEELKESNPSDDLLNWYEQHNDLHRGLNKIRKVFSLGFYCT